MAQRAKRGEQLNMRDPYFLASKKLKRGAEPKDQPLIANSDPLSAKFGLIQWPKEIFYYEKSIPKWNPTRTLDPQADKLDRTGIRAGLPQDR